MFEQEDSLRAPQPRDSCSNALIHSMEHRESYLTFTKEAAASTVMDPFMVKAP